MVFKDGAVISVDREIKTVMLSDSMGLSYDNFVYMRCQEVTGNGARRLDNILIIGNQRRMLHRRRNILRYTSPWRSQARTSFSRLMSRC